ncbi:class I adenylate-forming enzyme family protein [Legionella cherrii]|uniref:Acyl CoA synthetase, long chain fatty acid:CoA ligase n=1 Tax=Legionella cherrii TaxID=28084 RepID=A0A0W0SA15_9GAMM|nr:class I adenylate-forming enzyme family protein [Legionella cherrii]KTC80247.1 acyl CoA synthetase, long chain fatty acid:CoA ligase [Legionella cherrii]VEB38760.1 acyl CoA synthetase, long chain fatty acid:CoA ligase [Legionella cherrii]
MFTKNLIYSTREDSVQKTALILANKSVSYEELENVANGFAHFLTEMGLKGERIAFMLPNCVEIISIYLGCFKAGCIAMPINRRYAPPELERVIQDAEPYFLIIEEEKLFLLDKIDLTQTSIKQVFVVSKKGKTNGYPLFDDVINTPTEFEVSALSYDSPAVIFYTSGSIGKPKGVVHTLRSIEAILDSTSDALDTITSQDKMIVCEPQCHISGFMETFSTLSRGGTVLVYDGFNLNEYLDGLMKHKPTLAVPHIDTLMKLLDSGRCTADTFASLRGVYTGGDVLPEAVQQRFIACSGMSIHVGYGMTEGIWMTVCREKNPSSGCIGKPVKGVTLRLVDQSGKEVPPGEEGEILVKGNILMLNYWHNPDETQKTFIEGWFRTGDSGKQDIQGNYYFTGRIKDIIIRNTSNIMPGEVEAAIYQHPAIKAAAVIGIPDPHEGEVPIAFVVLKNGKRLTEPELSQFLTQYIAHYKIPVKVYFIDTIPLTHSGKINHKQLHDYLP